MLSAGCLVLLYGLTAVAHVASLPSRCVGGSGRLVVCVQTESYPPRRYDRGGLYGPEFFRSRYGADRDVLAPPPDYGFRYDYGVQVRPALRPPPPPVPQSSPAVFRPSPPVFRLPSPAFQTSPAVFRPSPPVFRLPSPAFQTSPPVFRPSPPVFRPSPPVFQPSPTVVVDHGFQKRTDYDSPVPYGGRYGYGGGFRPVVVVPQPYPTPTRSTQPVSRPFIIRPHVSGPHDRNPPHPDIRSFYRGASMLGRGQVSSDGRNNVQFVCDFRLAGITPATDVLTDVVWQKVGRSAYMNNPMTSVSTYPNALNCPNNYVVPTQTDYGFNIAGSKTTMVIKNATAADYGVYRCYATRVSRSSPQQRTPVYMEVYYTPTGTAGRG